jgi:hypothetical protein
MKKQTTKQQNKEPKKKVTKKSWPDRKKHVYTKKTGRPIKLSDTRIKVAESLLEWDIVTVQSWVDQHWEPIYETKTMHQFRAIFLTDEEFVTLVNEKLKDLKEEDKIFSYDSFSIYKNKVLWNAEEQTDNKPINNDEIELFKKFLSIIKKHLILQKSMLFENLSTTKKDRTRFAWIIERKFSDWNLKNISESKVDQTIQGKISLTDLYDATKK